MKYFLVKIQNGSVCQIFSYNTLDEAESEFHSELAYRSADRRSTVCAILDAAGCSLKVDAYGKTHDDEDEDI